MFRKKIIPQLFSATLYTLFVVLLGRLFNLQSLFFWLGVMIGSILIYLDPLVSGFISSPQDSPNVGIRLIEQKKLKEALLFALNQDLIQKEMILHSALFQVALTALCFYIVTSSNSFLGVGLVMGMALHLIRDEINLWRRPIQLNSLLFWNIHRQITPGEQKIYLFIIFAIFAVETVLLI